MGESRSVEMVRRIRRELMEEEKRLGREEFRKRIESIGWGGRGRPAAFRGTATAMGLARTRGQATIPTMLRRSAEKALENGV